MLPAFWARHLYLRQRAEAAAAANPDSASAEFQKAWQAYSQASREILPRLVELDPDFGPAWTELFESLTEREARDELETFRRLHPDSDLGPQVELSGAARDGNWEEADLLIARLRASTDSVVSTTSASA